MSIIRDGGATKQRVIAALVSGHTAKRAAKIVGIDRNVITRWRRDPKFQAALEAAVERQRNRIEIRLAKLADKALGTLSEGMEPTVGMKDRLDAAKTTLTAHVRAVGNRIKPKADPNAGPLLVFPPGTAIAVLAKPEQPTLPVATAVRAVPPGAEPDLLSVGPSLADLALPETPETPAVAAGADDEGDPQ